MKKNKFNNIIGYDNTKKTLERLIDVLNNPDKYKKLGSTIPHGLMLYGPPGLGKTTFAKEILRLTNRKNYIIRKTKSDGSFMDYISDTFNKAKKNQPSLILLDDLDKYSEDDRRHNNEEFVTVQSLIDDIKNEDIFVIATVNDRYVLPSSLTRSGRFDILIPINYPNEKDSYNIIKHYLKGKKLNKNVNIKNLSYILTSSSCADLEKACNQAGIYAGFENKEEITNDELLRAALELVYDVTIEKDDKEDDYAINTAYHEAGHALVGEVLEPDSVTFITIAKTDSNKMGMTIYHNNDNYFNDIKFMENRITTLLAGKAATEIIYNNCDTGADSDLHRAYGVANRLINDYCMLDFNSRIRDCDEQSEKVKQAKDDNINRLIQNYYIRAKEILIQNIDKLNLLANILKDKKILFKDEIHDILSDI